jgi:glycerol kinase
MQGEATALGAAFAAGLAVGVWKDIEELKQVMKAKANTKFSPNAAIDKDALKRQWNKAVERSFGWQENPKSNL